MIKIKIKIKGRADKLLSAELKNYSISRSYIQKLIKEKNILVNGKPIVNNCILKINDNVEVELPEKVVLNVEPQDIDFEIIYEDENIIIVNKPNDLVVHPSIGHPDNTLVNGLLKKASNLSDINGIIRPGIVHRIDRFTTGLLVVAKNNKYHQYLSEKIKTKEIKRYYYALVHGTFDHKTGTIDAPIGRDPKNRKRMAVTNKHSKNACTYFKVIKTFKEFSLIECELSTGRTHQIRVHLKYINHPIYGDDVYGRLSDRNNPFGQYLHAYMLKLINPITHKEMVFKCDLPKIFNDKIIQLSKEIKE